MEYKKVSEVARQWNISTRRVRELCVQDQIPGVVRKGKLYMIPEDAKKPEDRRLRKVSRFDQLTLKRELLDGLLPLTEGEVERLYQEFVVEYTYNSNAIEGNTLTLKETAMVLAGMTIDQKPLKDHLEAVGHRDAFEYITDIAKREVEVSESVIKNIHSLVLINKPQDRGVYRKIPVRIMGAYTEPVQPYLIEPRMNELVLVNKQRESTMHVVERIARFHLEFEGIHPFIDGNGRTGRLILNLDLIRNGYPPIDVKYTDRKRYYEAFDVYYRCNDASAMIDLICGYVDERLDEYIEIMR